MACGTIKVEMSAETWQGKGGTKIPITMHQAWELKETHESSQMREKFSRFS
jgi:hypothetical protein